jgi:hypothetical protein
MEVKKNPWPVQRRGRGAQTGEEREDKTEAER